MVVGKFSMSLRSCICTGIAVLAMGSGLGWQPVAAQPAATSGPANGGLEGYTEQTFTDADGQEHRYRLLFPAGYQQEGDTQYPLVLLLHGAGERGDDNRAQLVHGAAEFARADRQAAYPCFVVVP